MLCLKNIDMFGSSYKFTFNREERFRHHVGGLFTLFYFMIAAYLIYSLGKDIVVKDQPITFSYIYHDYQWETYPVVNLSLAFEDWSTGRPEYRDLVAEGYFEIHAEYKGGDGYVYNNQTFRRCKPTDFKVNLTYYKEAHLDINAYCPTSKFYNNTVNCKYKEESAYYMELSIKPCKNSTICKSELEIYELLKTRNIFVNFLKEHNYYYPDLPGALSTEVYIVSKSYLMDPDLTINVQYKYEDAAVSSDLSVFDVEVTWMFYQNLIEGTVKNLKRTSMQSNDYMNFILYNNPDTIVHNRRYKKITELIALTGSLLNIVGIIFSFWVKLLYKMRMKEILMNKVFYVNANEDAELRKKLGGKVIENKEDEITAEEKREKIKLLESNLVKKNKSNLNIEMMNANYNNNINYNNDVNIIKEAYKSNGDNPQDYQNNNNNNKIPKLVNPEDQNYIYESPKLKKMSKLVVVPNNNPNHNILDVSAIELSPMHNNKNDYINNIEISLRKESMDDFRVIPNLKQSNQSNIPLINPINMNINSNNNYNNINYGNGNDNRNNVNGSENGYKQKQQRIYNNYIEEEALINQNKKKKKVVEDKFNLLKSINEKETLSSNNNFNSESKSIYLLSMMDYTTLICCKCFANRRISDIKDTYDKLEPIISQYSDIVFNVRKTYDLEKIQYLLFDKTQFAIFNSSKKIDNPMNVIGKGGFTQFYQFIKNNRAQESVYREYLRNLEKVKKQKRKTKFDKKLADLMKQ